MNTQAQERVNHERHNCKRARKGGVILYLCTTDGISFTLLSLTTLNHVGQPLICNHREYKAPGYTNYILLCDKYVKGRAFKDRECVTPDIFIAYYICNV